MIYAFSVMATQPAEQVIARAGVAAWGILFALGVVFAGLALRQRGEVWTQHLVWLLGFCGVMIALWMIGLKVASPPVLALAFLVLAAQASWRAAAKMHDSCKLGSGPLKGVADAFSGLLSGWLAVTAATTLPQIIRAYSNIAPTDFPWLLLWSALVPLLIATYVFTRWISDSLWYYVALIWGLLAIALNCWLVTDTHWLGHITAIIACLILYLRLTRGADGATAEN